MNKNLLLIICAIGVVALIYLIRYIIAKVVYKGTDAIENKLRQIEPGTRATGNQSLAERLGVPGQNPPAVQSNQTPPPQPVSPQPGNPADIQVVSAQGQTASFCTQCGAAVKPGSAFCTKCGAELKKN